jgi:hypothetical protein
VRGTWVLAASALLASAFLASPGRPAAAAPAKARELFRLVDPRGDDSGAGGLVYPARPDMHPGDLDLVAFSARNDAQDEGTWFTVEFARPIRNPAGEVTPVGQTPISSMARLGFYTFNVDVYIDTDRIAGSGSVETVPGRGVAIDRATAWEKAILLSPRPDAARSLLKNELGTRSENDFRAKVGRVLTPDLRKIEAQTDFDIDEHYYFPRRVQVNGNAISFFVPKSFLGGDASTHWAYAVIVTGADVEQYGRGGQLSPPRPTMLTMPTMRGIAPDGFGIRGDADAATPPVVDLLAPEPSAQARILNDFDMVAGRLPAVPGIAPDGSVSMTPAGGTVTTATREQVEALRGGAAPPAAAPTQPPAAGPAPRTAATPGPATDQPAAPAAPKTVAERLRVLNQLLQQGLITQAEYAELRRKILSEL